MVAEGLDTEQLLSCFGQAHTLVSLIETRDLNFVTCMARSQLRKTGDQQSAEMLSGAQ